MKSSKLSVIVPIYNERATIARVLDCVIAWRKASEIIVVDDGSTDDVGRELARYSHRITVVRLQHNQGKSHAMATGAICSHGTYIMFLDGDLVGLQTNHLDDLLFPVVSGYADMTIGTRESRKYGIFWSLKPFGGERVMKRSELLSFLPTIRQSGFGVEVLLNEHFRSKRIVYIPLWDLSHMMKFEKYPPAMAAFLYVREFWEVAPRHVWYHVKAFIFPFAK